MTDKAYLFGKLDPVAPLLPHFVIFMHMLMKNKFQVKLSILELSEKDISIGHSE